MKTTTQMVAEMNALLAVRAIHKAKIDAAAVKADDLQAAFEDAFGFHPSDAPGHAPGWEAANAACEALADDSGYYWLCSRIHDLEIVLFSGRLVAPPQAPWSCAHVVGIGDMPKAHASVAGFVAQCLGLEAA